MFNMFAHFHLIITKHEIQLRLMGMPWVWQVFGDEVCEFEAYLHVEQSETLQRHKSCRAVRDYLSILSAFYMKQEVALGEKYTLC